LACKPVGYKGILINTDSEQEGEIYMGCAGGVDFVSNLPLQREAVPAGYQTLKLTIKGLRGGHSGVQIHLGRGNATKLLARFLFEHADVLGLRVLDLTGGTLRNAIPREAFATLAVPADKVATLQQLAQDYLVTLNHELGAVEQNITVLVEPTSSNEQALNTESQARLLALLNSTPNGVIRMSDEIKGVVETSLNLGVVEISENVARVNSLIRSLIDSGRDSVVSSMTALGQLAGAENIASGSYPGWKPDNSSPIIAQVRELYREIFQREPAIMVIHAGLECGLFKKPYPDMEMVSIGPTITGPHSPDEQVHIESVGQYWQLLTGLLKNIPERA